MLWPLLILLLAIKNRFPFGLRRHLYWNSHRNTVYAHLLQASARPCFPLPCRGLLEVCLRQLAVDFFVYNFLFIKSMAHKKTCITHVAFEQCSVSVETQPQSRLSWIIAVIDNHCVRKPKRGSSYSAKRAPFSSSESLKWRFWFSAETGFHHRWLPLSERSCSRA